MYPWTLADFRRSLFEELGADRRLSDRLPPRARDLRIGEVKRKEEKSRKCKLRKTSKVYGRTDPFALIP